MIKKTHTQRTKPNLRASKESTSATPKAFKKARRKGEIGFIQKLAAKAETI